MSEESHTQIIKTLLAINRSLRATIEAQNDEIDDLIEQMCGETA